MSSDDDEDNLSWDMLDDRKFVMWPGYKFPSPMSYKEMCSQVNMEVQKAGSDAVRPKIRKTVSVGGRAVPASVQFYCCHKRQHKKRVKPLKTPDAKRADRSHEGRSHLFSNERERLLALALMRGAALGELATAWAELLSRPRGCFWRARSGAGWRRRGRGGGPEVSTGTFSSFNRPLAGNGSRAACYAEDTETKFWL